MSFLILTLEFCHPALQSAHEAPAKTPHALLARISSLGQHFDERAISLTTLLILHSLPPSASQCYFRMMSTGRSKTKLCFIVTLPSVPSCSMNLSGCELVPPILIASFLTLSYHLLKLERSLLQAPILSGQFTHFSTSTDATPPHLLTTKSSPFPLSPLSLSSKSLSSTPRFLPSVLKAHCLTAQSVPWMICSHLQVHSSFISAVNSLFATVPPFHSAFYFIFKIDLTYFMLMRSFPDTQSTCRQRFCSVGLDSMMSGSARIWFTLQPFWDWPPAFSCPQPVDWSSFGTLKAGF